MPETPAKPARVPPRWFVRSFWSAHRGVCRITGGRLGLWSPKPGKWGAMRLTTIGRRSGQERSVILGYIEDGPNLVVIAMNGWDEGHPAWWLNLEAHPDAVVRLSGETERPVHAFAATGDERERLWKRWAEVEPDLDGYAGRRTTEAPVVVFEPRDATA